MYELFPIDLANISCTISFLHKKLILSIYLFKESNKSPLILLKITKDRLVSELANVRTFLYRHC